MPQTFPEPKEARLSIRASGPDKTLLAQAARARRVPVSRFVLQASLEAARAVLTEPTEFRLPPEQWEAFCRRLDAPPQGIPALNRLFAEPEPFDAWTAPLSRDARAFYQKFGMKPSPTDPLHLFLLFKDIRQSLSELHP